MHTNELLTSCSDNNCTQVNHRHALLYRVASVLGDIQAELVLKLGVVPSLLKCPWATLGKAVFISFSPGQIKTLQICRSFFVSIIMKGKTKEEENAERWFVGNEFYLNIILDLFSLRPFCQSVVFLFLLNASVGIKEFPSTSKISNVLTPPWIWRNFKGLLHQSSGQRLIIPLSGPSPWQPAMWTGWEVKKETVVSSEINHPRRF